jgi:hypothetical protein
VIGTLWSTFPDERMLAIEIDGCAVVNIRNISALRGIHETENGLTIGALSTLAEISEHLVVQSRHQILSDACVPARRDHHGRGIARRAPF